MTSYLTLIETKCLSCTFLSYGRLFPKIWKRHVTDHAHTSDICNPNTKASHGEPVYKIWSV